MTTIAYDGKSIAADTQISLNGDTWCNRSKVIQTKTGLIIAAGDCQDAHLVADWIDEGMPKDKRPNVDAGFFGFVVHEGNVFEIENKVVLMPATPNTAAGSGWVWATAAMDHNKTALEAVQYAGTRDHGTSGAEIVYGPL